MKALALVDAPDHVCCRYRIRAFEPALRTAGGTLTYQGLEHGTLRRFAQLREAAAFDTVILQRRLLPRWQLGVLRRSARRLVFDFDDAVLYRDSYDRRGPRSWKRGRRFAETVRLADAVIAGNDFLADCALRAGATAGRIQVIPTCIDTARYQPNPVAREGLELVWIGSSSTLQGLERQRPIWERIGREVPGARLRLICDRFPRFGPLPVVPVAWAEATEAAELAAGDVGISWVPDDLWSRGKCGLKVLQYQAAGLPVLTNPVGVHPEMVQPGVSGFLPGSVDEWVDAARTLARDTGLRLRMGQAARAAVESGYSLSAWAATFIATLVGTPEQSSRRGRIGARPHVDSVPSRAEGLARCDGPTEHDGARMSWLFKKATARPPATGRLFEPPDWQWAQSGDVSWWVRDDWAPTLLGPDGLRLDEWRDQNRLTVVKTGPHRVVYRADLPEGAVFVKHFLVPDFRAKLRQWVRRGKGRNEALRTLYLGAIGVSTITPVALGEQRRRQLLYENYLITHAIPETVPLDTFVEHRLLEWPEERRARVRRNLAVALAVLTARLHDAGILHQDFHPGNILVSMEADDQPRLAMIDLDGLRVTRPVWQVSEHLARFLKIDLNAQRWTPPLTWSQAQRNLALLDHYFWMRYGRIDRHRFVRAYLNARDQPDKPEVGAFAREIETLTRAWAERLWRRWGRRCRSSNKYFVVGRGTRTWAVASRDLASADLTELLANPDAPFQRADTVILKESRTTTVAETTLTVSGRPTRVIYKRFNRKSWYEPFLTYFRPSKAWQSWQAAQDLVSRALPTPKNLAYIARLAPFGHDLFWYLPQKTYLITAKEENAVTLGEYALNTLPALDPESRRIQRRRLTLALARLLRNLHERSLSDRDLKAANILVLGDPATGDVKLSLIDLVGVRLLHPLPWNRRVQNLARLHLSMAQVEGRTRTDALRFLRAYLPWGLSPLNDWKGLWRDVAARGQTKRERNQRSGRVLS